MAEDSRDASLDPATVDIVSSFAPMLIAMYVEKAMPNMGRPIIVNAYNLPACINIRLPGMDMAYVSFDVEGTLVTKDFSNHVWLRLIPLHYARTYGLEFEEAYKYVTRQYSLVGERRAEWYMLDYWIDRLGLRVEPEDLLEEASSLVKPFRDAVVSLRGLNDAYRVILVTNSPRLFLKYLLRPFRDLRFHRVFSVVDDFGLTKYSMEAYGRVAGELGVEPSKIFHLGDHYIQDYVVPRRLGIQAYHLSRDRDSGLKSVEEFTRLVRGVARGADG